MKLIMENWRSYVSNLNEAQDMSHVQIAQAELSKFNNGELKEQNPEAWPLIQEYWRSLGTNKYDNYALAVKTYRNPNSFMSKQGAWSAAFIQYCMKNNKEFQKLSGGSKKGAHLYYSRPGQKNTNKLLNGDDIEDNDWVYLSDDLASKIEYTEQVGDIAFQKIKTGSKIHGDIVTPAGKIGGNLSDSVMVTNKPTIAILTQNPEVKQKLKQLINKEQGDQGEINS